MTLATLDQLQFSQRQLAGVDDILAIANQSNSQVQTRVRGLERSFYQINVAQAMESLSRVTGLLRLAYAGSKGFPCAKHVIAIQSDFQGLSKDSLLTTGVFVNSTVSALKWHKMAVTLVEKGKLEAALKILKKCAEVADKMAKASGTLAGRAQLLCNQSREALVQATDDETVTTEKRNEVKTRIAESVASEAKLKSLSEALAVDVAEAKERERKAEKKADKARDRAFVMSIVSTIVQGAVSVGSAAIGGTAGAAGAVAGALSQGGQSSSSTTPTSVPPNSELSEAFAARKKSLEELEEMKIALATKQKLLENAEKDSEKEKVSQLEKEIAELEAKVEVKGDAASKAQAALGKVQQSLEKRAESLEQIEAQRATERAELQQQQRENNAKLAETVTLLKGLHMEKDRLGVSIQSLEVVIQTMGKVKTVFENCRIFWEGVKIHCEHLTDTDVLQIAQEVEEKELFLEGLADSAWSWIVLGKICDTANRSIKVVDEGVDSMMTNIPTSEEARALVGSIADDILLQIQEENEAIEQIAAQ